MPMAPGLRKLALTTHVAASVGWLGSVAAFLALALVGFSSQDARQVQGAYLAMTAVGWYVIVPLAFASLLTGLLQSLGTSWGLLRHYWVLAKLVLTALATFLLMLHMQVADRVAGTAARTGLAASDPSGMRIQLVVDACAALLVLLTATALSIYKPRGITPYGWRVLQAHRPERQDHASRDTKMPARA